MRSTASASVSVTVVPLTATGSVSARSAASPPTVTAKSLAAGTEPAASSSAPSKVTVSVEPVTAAEENTGRVLLVTCLLPKLGAALPERSRTCATPLIGAYLTCTVWPWVTAEIRVPVTVAPSTPSTEL